MPITRDEILQALQGLSPEQLAGLITDNHGRSPFRERQLTDLSLKPSARDPRPTFFAETDGREFQPILQRPYPKLLWHVETHEEITVANEQEHQARGAMWTTTAPTLTPMTTEEMVRRQFDALSDEDKNFILEHQRQLRLNMITQAMGTLTDSQVASFAVRPKGK